MPSTERLRTVGRRRSLGREVTDALRDMILTGELRSGEPITHEGIAARLGVSIMPAREALLQLSHEGLVEATESRRHRVRALTRDDLRDVYWVHGTIAGELARRACRNGGAHLAGDLDEVQAQWEAVIAAGGDPDRLDALNDRFHAVINRAAGAPKLLLVLRHSLRLIPQHFYALVPSWREVSTRGHGELVDAIRAGDADAAERHAREHVLEAGELLTAYFVDSGYWESPAAVAGSA